MPRGLVLGQTLKGSGCVWKSCALDVCHLHIPGELIGRELIRVEKTGVSLSPRTFLIYYMSSQKFLFEQTLSRTDRGCFKKIQAPWAIILRAALAPHCATEYKSFLLPGLTKRWGFNLCLPSLSVHCASEYKPQSPWKSEWLDVCPCPVPPTSKAIQIQS